MAEQLRVAVLYRASTKKQQKSQETKTRTGKRSARKADIEDDLPLQRKECERLIQEKGWTITGIEYIEGGVSGYHTHTSKRKELQRAYEDAKNGLYDILLLYKLDRFGRRAAESLDMAIKFLRHARIWTTDRGEFRNDGDADEIKNFIEFWSAKRSSSDTKKRVTDAMKQLHEEGIWTGGNTPYGYNLHDTEALKLVINEEEAEVIRVIYRLYCEGWGFLRIASYLNERGYKPREADSFKVSNLMRMTKNPVYKGVLAYGKTQIVEREFGGSQVRKPMEEWSYTQPIPEYQIVSEQVWDLAWKLRQERVEKMRIENPNFKANFIPTSKKSGRHLLSGISYCGYCGAPMSTRHETSNWTNMQGKQKGKYVIYKCKGRLQGGQALCSSPKSSVKKEKIENAVTEQVKMFTVKLANSKFFNEIEEFTSVSRKALDFEYHQLIKELEKQGKIKDRANAARKRYFLSETEEEIGIPEAQLSELYTEANKAIEKLNARKEELDAAKSHEELSREELGQLVNVIKDWGPLFDQAEESVKKQMILKIIERVDVYEDTAKVQINLKIAEFFQTVMGAHIEVAASLENNNQTPPKLNTVGVPTVVYASTIVSNTMNMVLNHMQQRTPNTQPMFGTFGTMQDQQRLQMVREVLQPLGHDLLVTPKEIDMFMEDIANIIASGLNAALHDAVDTDNVAAYTH